MMITVGNAISLPLQDESIDCCVTSPPYWGLRDYGSDGQLGLESTPEDYVAIMVSVFREVLRVLKPEGTLWLNLGDSYANDGKWGGSSGGKHAAGLHGKTGIGRGKKTTGLKPKDLVGIPWRVALALQQDGWYLRSDIIWAKPNPMPESVRDRPTKSHEYLFLLTKSQRYYFDQDAVAEAATGLKHHDLTGGGYSPPGQPAHTGSRSGPAKTTRNLRDVWTIATQPFPGAHFAVMPPKLVEPCIKAGCPEGGTVLDPFAGAGTVGLVADRLRRKFVGVELNPAFALMARDRIVDDCPLLQGVE